MYKNFKLTEGERSEILKMHGSYGYRKPLKEQEEMGGSMESGDENTQLKDIKIQDFLDEDEYQVSYYGYDTIKKENCIVTFSKVPDNSWAYDINYESAEMPGFGGTRDQLKDLKIRF